ncbi:MAG: isochorismatase family protein, partial [bacterium]|nr:isochorismatase family protein [bacterium]
MVPFEYSTDSALVIVDVQNDFADPAGSLSVHGGEDVVEFINEQIGQAQAAGAFVVYTQDWHPADTPHFAKDGGIWPVHCVADSWGAAFHSRLRVVGPSVMKGT